MDDFLPPATPQQIADIYAQFPTTHRAVLLTHWEILFALVPVALHLALPWLMLAAGFSAALRGRAAYGAAWLLRLGLVSGLMQRLDEREKQRYDKAHGTWLAGPAAWDQRLSRWTRGLRLWREWDSCFIRTIFLYALGYALLYRLAWVPFSYGAYRLDAAYGLTRMSAAAWLSESGSRWLDGLAVNTAGTVLLIGLIRFSPRRWPFLLALLFACTAALFLRLPPDSSPAVKPLPAGSRLSRRLHALTARAGVPEARIVIDESGEGKYDPNGSASHAGGVPYISLTRKMVDTEPEAQVEATVAHEVGHCVHQDDVRMLLPTALGVFIAFPFIRWLAERLLRRFGARWHVGPLADPAALPLLLLCFHLVTLVTDPLANAYSRALEHRADAYGLALTRDRLPMAQQFVGFSRHDGTSPDPPMWFVFWHDDHPSNAERIRFALFGQPS